MGNFRGIFLIFLISAVSELKVIKVKLNLHVEFEFIILPIRYLMWYQHKEIEQLLVSRGKRLILAHKDKLVASYVSTIVKVVSLKILRLSNLIQIDNFSSGAMYSNRQHVGNCFVKVLWC